MGVTLSPMFTTVQALTVDEPKLHRLILIAVLTVSAGAANAQPYDRTWTFCLLKPEQSTDVTKDCNAVIDSAKATPTEKAIALNNRALDAKTPEAAGRDFDEAIRLAPTIAKIYNNRGTNRLGTPALAIEDYTAAIRIDPNYAVAYTSRGEAYQLMGKHDEAIRDFDQAIKLAPQYMHPMYNPYESRARSKEEKGDLKGAEADRAFYLKIMSSKGAAGYNSPNARGARAWEPWVTK